MSKRKAPGNLNNPNHDMCDFLIELANYEKNVSKNVFKASAYRKAASTLGALPNRVKSGDEAKRLPGIGVKIAKKIDEFLETGKLRKLENTTFKREQVGQILQNNSQCCLRLTLVINQDENNVAINLLTRVSGIGPSKAKELVDAGVKTLEDLKKNINKLNHHQKLGLKYFDDFEKKIPRDEIAYIEKCIQEALRELDDIYVMTICGSYRRGKTESGDIDLLITHPSYNSNDKESKKNTSLLKSVVKCLEKRGLITDMISQGGTKFMGVCRLPGNKSKPNRRLDIRLSPYDQYYCAVLYFTGSDLFNRDMRTRALEKKFTLNEYSLRRLTIEGLPGEAENITSEEDIFRILGMAYKDPKDRNM